MDFKVFISELCSFPNNVFFIPFILFFVLMLVDLVFDIFEAVIGDIDLFDFDDVADGGLLIPPVLSKVPLAVVLCVSFFFATIIEFYLVTHLTSLLPESLELLAHILSIPLVAFSALHVSAFMLKPLSPLFNKENSFAKINYIGLKARVHSSRVDESQGEVVIIHQGNEVLLSVFAERSQSIQYGDSVVVISKDNKLQRYLVAKI